MANSDRISEVYKGEIWAESTQQVARDRIHWLVGQATGDVLDIGCSQGIASILCARRGLNVVGIDIQADRIEYARRRAGGRTRGRAREARLPARRRRRARLSDASFDTVLMGEIVEHSEDASPLLAEAARVLRPQGLLVLTTPFGLSRHHDHYATFYVDSLVRLLAPHFTVESLDVVDRYLRACGRPGAMADPDRLVVESQPLMERALVAIQESMADEKEKMRRYDIAIARYEQVNARMKNLESRLAHQSYRTDYVTWQLKSAKSRKWWRLGEALWSAKRPAQALKLPKNVATALKSSPRLEEPQPETTAGSPDLTGHYSAVAIPEVAIPDGPVARDLKVAVILDVFSTDAFRYEWQQIKFGPEDWREVLERERPSTAVRRVRLARQLRPLGHHDERGGRAQAARTRPGRLVQGPGHPDGLLEQGGPAELRPLHRDGQAVRPGVHRGRRLHPALRRGGRPRPGRAAAVRRAAADSQPRRGAGRPQARGGVRRDLPREEVPRARRTDADDPRPRTRVRPAHLQPHLRRPGLRVPGRVHRLHRRLAAVRADAGGVQGVQDLLERQLGDRVADDVRPPRVRAVRLRHPGGVRSLTRAGERLRRPRTPARPRRSRPPRRSWS